MTKPELEKRIFLHLSKIPFSTFDELRQIFKCTKNDLIEINIDTINLEGSINLIGEDGDNKGIKWGNEQLKNRKVLAEQQKANRHTQCHSYKQSRPKRKTD